jgi:hypothetical protein
MRTGCQYRFEYRISKQSEREGTPRAVLALISANSMPGYSVFETSEHAQAVPVAVAAA